MKEYYIIRMGEKLFFQAVSPAEGGHYEAKFTTNAKRAGTFADEGQAKKMSGLIGGEIRTQFEWGD